jgi:hypothetical protein
LILSLATEIAHAFDVSHAKENITVPFKIIFSGDEFLGRGILSVVRQVQRDTAKVGKGSELYGGDVIGKTPELSVGEDARRRYLELLAQQKLAKQQRVQR